jgi:hypothetical protein
MKTKPVAGVYSYSFALRPSEVVQPSGSCNFSRYVAFSTLSALSLTPHTSYWKSHSSPRSHLLYLQDR